MKETLVFIPGMLCDERLFSRQLAHCDGRYDVHVEIPKGDGGIAAMADRILTAVRAEHFSVMGLSMGGIVAMAMIAQAPERIARLALLDSNHRAESEERKKLRDRQIRDVRAGQFHDVVKDELKLLYLGSANAANAMILDQLFSMALALGPAVFIEQSEALRDRADARDALASYHGPSLVLCGEEDRLCPPERHAEMAALLPQSELVIVPKSGHISTMESPAMVNAALDQWMKTPPYVAS
jgi:pimeloyl-ACP methyl ester carboxylesterase